MLSPLDSSLGAVRKYVGNKYLFHPDDSCYLLADSSLVTKSMFIYILNAMRCVVQRVQEACVTVAGKVVGAIGPGLLLLVGIEEQDTPEDGDWLAKKVVRLRIFDDPAGVMNLSVRDIRGEILIISQFTLHADLKKGNRPSYHRAARPEQALPLYHSFIRQVEQELGKKVETGEFGAYMAVSLVNDGPVTILYDTKAL
jgi:D-tyrosyl-tRNA(Tyr) deacylase